MPSAEEQLELQDEPIISKREASAHTKALSELITLGKITGCSVWIAADNQGRTTAGRSLAADCLTDLPPRFEQAIMYNSRGSLMLWSRKRVGVSAYIWRKLLGGGNGVPNASRIAFGRASGVGKRVTAVPWTW